MTAGSDGLSAREAGIAQRWEGTAGQVARTADAVRERHLNLANTDDELIERRVRLKRHGLELEGIVGEDGSVWLSFFSVGLKAARAVGRIVRIHPGQPHDPVATGVLIGPELLLTNNHVIASAEEADGMGVELGYDYGDDGSELPYDTCGFEPGRCFWTSEELDCTVVAVAALDGRPPGGKYGTVPLIGQTGKAVKAEVLNVIHHPGGMRKRLTIRANRMVAEDELWLRYTSATQHGSSGAPVFNDQWEMVALHHGGVPMRDQRGVQLDRAGEPWLPGMDPEAKAYMANEGARVSRIVSRLQAAPLEPGGRELVGRALRAGVI